MSTINNQQSTINNPEGNPKILIVDDEPDILRFLNNLLTQEGYMVKAASGGREALDLFKADPFDLVITDIRMPGMDGMEVLKQARQLDENIEVIILTGFATVDNAVETLKADGAFDYLTKPLENIDGLLNTVNQALEKRRLRLENRTLLVEIKKLSSAIEQSIDGIAIGDFHPKLIYVNNSFASIHGYSPKEMVGMKYLDLYDKNHLGEINQIIDQTKTHGSWMGETEHMRKDGTTFPTFMSTTLLKESNNKPSAMLAIVRDITNQKRLKSQLHHAQKMEALGTLAGGIAHNFNNLLMGIMGNASLMLLDVDDTHPHYENLISIETLVENGSKLTSQLLGYARKGGYETRPIDLNRVVKNISNTFGTTKKEIIVHNELAKDLGGIIADEGQIEQVLMNLFVNAADAMPAGGDLFVKTINITHRDIKDKPYKPKPGKYVLLTVRDTGIGMDDKTVKHIFEPFFTTKGLASGTGLGLASVYGIAKAHGGYIDVQTMKGKGTTFSIYLPATRKSISNSFEMEKQIVKGRENILLVDDEEIVLDIGVKILEYLGYTVFKARDGREAIEVFEANRDKIDLVIIDMIMPGMGGGDVYNRMKEIKPDAKFILSSGYGIEGQAAEILKSGCDGFIQKPFKMDELSGKIRSILDEK